MCNVCVCACVMHCVTMQCTKPKDMHVRNYYNPYAELYACVHVFSPSDIHSPLVVSPSCTYMYATNFHCLCHLQRPRSSEEHR